MESTSAADTSGGRTPGSRAIPACVRARAHEVLDLAVLKILALCLGGSAGGGLLALAIAVVSPPNLHYIPGVGR